MGIQDHIPRMFHRRLLLLAAAAMVMMLPLAAQLARLTIVEGAELRRDAQRRLVTERLIGNVRGRILDRSGRVLAVDVPTYDVAVPYACITGAWAETNAVRLARRQNRDTWRELDPAEREALAGERLAIFSQRLDEMWDGLAETAGVLRSDIDARCAEIERTVDDLAEHVKGQQRIQYARRLAVEREISFDEALEQASSSVSREIREETAAHVILAGVDDQIAFELMRRVNAADDGTDAIADVEPFSTISVVRAGRREYPHEIMQVVLERDTLPKPLRNETPAVIEVRGVAPHIVGWMRDRHYKEDVEHRAREYAARTGAEYDKEDDRGRYLATDRIGIVGIEGADEFDLRGLRGRERKHLDTGEVDVEATLDGRDVHLTIDIDLQARVGAILDPDVGLTIVQSYNLQRPASGVPVIGDHLAAAAVVIDIDSSDILAMVSAPSFTRTQLRDDPDAVLRDLRTRRSRNRAIDVAYAPGSIVKPIILCAATTEDVYDTRQHISCTGHFLENRPDILRCWIKKQFDITHNDQLGHDLDGSDAIMGSCNIFFFELGRRLGPERVAHWFGRFGVGPEAVNADFGIGLQFEGAIGRLVDGERLDPIAGEAIQMAIGQGPIAWTPLHAAAAYAALGRGGVYMTPRLRLDDTPEVIDLELDQAGVDQALDGLRRSVVESYGTTHHVTVPDGEGGAVREPTFNVPGITVWAKSGTAQASALVDTDKSVIRDGDHAWCVLLAGPAGERPHFAVAVVTEYGGSGGRTSGPIANQILWALVRTGHLRPAESAG